jgi:hypothetical protein
LSAPPFLFRPRAPRFFFFVTAGFGAGLFAVALAVAFGAGFFAVDFGTRAVGGDRTFGGDLSFGGDRCFGGDLGIAARRVGDDFGVAVGEFPAPPDLVVIGDMVS